MRPSARWIAQPHGPGTRPTRRLTTHPGMKSAEKNARRIQSWFGQKNELPVPNENLKHNHPVAPPGAALFTFLLRAAPFPVFSVIAPKAGRGVLVRTRIADGHHFQISNRCISLLLHLLQIGPQLLVFGLERTDEFNRLFCSFFSAYRGKIAKDTKAYCVYIQLLNVHCCPPPLAAGATPATHKPLHRLLHPRIQAISPNLRRSWPGCGRRWTKFVLVCTEGTKKFWPLYRRYCSHFCK